MKRKPFKAAWEKFVHVENYNSFTVTYMAQCPQSQLVGKSTFIDDYSRCCAVYFLKHESEVFEKFKEYEARVTNDSGQPIGTLRSDKW